MLVYYQILPEMKRILIFISFIIVSFTLSAQTAYIPPEKPRLVIGIIVEQLRYDQLERMRDMLPDNGIRRMVNEGTYYRNASHDYLLTQAAPGMQPFRQALHLRCTA